HHESKKPGTKARGARQLPKGVVTRQLISQACKSAYTSQHLAAHGNGCAEGERARAEQGRHRHRGHEPVVYERSPQHGPRPPSRAATVRASDDADGSIEKRRDDS